MKTQWQLVHDGNGDGTAKVEKKLYESEEAADDAAIKMMEKFPYRSAWTRAVNYPVKVSK